MAKSKKKRLGDLLIENNMITQTQLEEALRAQTVFGGKIGTNLVELGYISEASLTNFLSAQLNIPATKPEDFTNIPPEIIQLVPKEFALEHKLVPLQKNGKRLKVAISDPYDARGIDELSFKTNLIIDLSIAPEILIVYALETYYGIIREARYIRLTGVPTEEMRLTDNLVEEIQTGNPNEARPKAHPYPIESLSADLAKTETKEEIFNILLKYFEFYFQKLAIFIVRHGAIQGFVCQGFQISKDHFRNLEIPLARPSAFKDVVEKQTIYVGGLPDSDIHDLIKLTLKIERTNDAYLIPLLLNNQTISVLLCYSHKDIDSNEIPLKDFDLVSKKISYAFQILFLKKKILS